MRFRYQAFRSVGYNRHVRGRMRWGTGRRPMGRRRDLSVFRIRESATALADPSSRPARRCAAERAGMTAREMAASTIPGREVSGAVPVKNVLTASPVT